MNIDAKLQTCPICGYEFTDRRHTSLKWVAVILAVLFLLMAVKNFFL